MDTTKKMFVANVHLIEPAFSVDTQYTFTYRFIFDVGYVVNSVITRFIRIGADECKRSGLDMTAVCSALNNSSENDVTAVVSMDPGRYSNRLVYHALYDYPRYLCDFIYYTSLNQNAGCSAFVHVPPLDKPYSAAQLGRALRAAVRAMLAQLL